MSQSPDKQNEPRSKWRGRVEGLLLVAGGLNLLSPTLAIFFAGAEGGSDKALRTRDRAQPRIHPAGVARKLAGARHGARNRRRYRTACRFLLTTP